jgi:hypothetical protein
MRKHSRRRFISQLFAAAISSTVLNRTASTKIGQLNEGLVELCVITREPGKLPNAVVDVWTGQIGVLDFAQLPEQLGKVIVWDDIRGDRAISRSIIEILVAIEKYFGIKPKLGFNAVAHVGHFSGLSRSIEMLFSTFQAGDPDPIGCRIAVIDLSSCGLTRLHWLDVIPLLRPYYTHVVGVDYSFPNLCELDPECRPPYGLSNLAYSTMRACDDWLLASDVSLSGRVELSIEERSNEFTRSIFDLCGSLASAKNGLDCAITRLVMRQFAICGGRA